MEAAVRDGVLRRIERRGNTEHAELFDYVLPADCPVPRSSASSSILVPSRSR